MPDTLLHSHRKSDAPKPALLDKHECERCGRESVREPLVVNDTSYHFCSPICEMNILII